VIVDKNRLWVIGILLVIGAVVGLGWLLGISPKLSEVRLAQADRDTTLAQNSAYELQVIALKKQFEKIDELTDELAAIQLAVPSSGEIPALIDELNSIAASSQVVITGFTQNDAQAYDPALLVVTAPAAGAPTPAPTSGATPSPAPSNAANAATEAATAGVVPVAGADPRLTSANFIAIPLSITATGPYDRVLDFVSGIQHGRRLLLINALSTVSTADGAAAGTVTGTITAFAYVLDSNTAAPPLQ
jgi:Tfp pilus assembly protein PilO